MGLLDPLPPPYDPIAWSTQPLAERGRMVCEAWAMQGYGTPAGAFAFYALKIGVYIGVWLLACRGIDLLSPLAFQKAIVWSLLFEILGLGCGSGPLTGRYFPPIGGFLYWLRPGTTKLPLFPGLPIIGNRTRGVLDILVYAGIIGLCISLLFSIDRTEIIILLALVAAIGILDKTIFLAARAEHYGTTLLVFAFATNWIAGAMCVQLALWFWAGFSKLNHHFPTVVCVMTSNGPFTRFAALRRKMYRAYPHDLRPSQLATWIAHAGTALEISVPVAFLAGYPTVGIVLALFLHGYITSSVPMGVPLEWNFMMVYGAFALFWKYPIVAFGPGWLCVVLAILLIGIPLIGNLVPARVSFLLAMRYYAGNWPYSIWLFRGDAYRKLDRLVKPSAWVYDQLARFYDKPTAVGLVGKVVGFRLMHLHGRALPRLVPQAIDRLEDHEWLDGELVAGMALGWNFGDGHLHREQLLASLQAQCGFEPGELRCIFVEPQALGGDSLAYRIADAATGPIASGTLPIDDLRARQPWIAS